MSYEEQRAEFETKRNEHVDAYFEARPDIKRTREREYFIETGFRMAWDFLKNQEPDSSV